MGCPDQHVVGRNPATFGDSLPCPGNERLRHHQRVDADQGHLLFPVIEDHCTDFAGIVQRLVEGFPISAGLLRPDGGRDVLLGKSRFLLRRCFGRKGPRLPSAERQEQPPIREVYFAYSSLRLGRDVILTIGRVPDPGGCRLLASQCRKPPATRTRPILSSSGNSCQYSPHEMELFQKAPLTPQSRVLYD